MREESRRRKLTEEISGLVEQSRFREAALGLLSFLESTVLPIPLEVVLLPYLVAHRDRAWRAATAVTLGCILGALLGYAIGAGALAGPGDWLRSVMIDSPSDDFESRFREGGFLAILLTGISPAPFQIAMLAAGATGYPLGLYLAAVILSRGLRYFGLVGLVLVFGGERAERFWERSRWKLGLALFALLSLLYLLSKGIGMIAGI